MQKPKAQSPEDTTEPDMVVSLEESGDVEEENVEYSGVAAFIEGQFRRAKDDSVNNEEWWMMAVTTIGACTAPRWNSRTLRSPKPHNDPTVQIYYLICLQNAL